MPRPSAPGLVVLLALAVAIACTSRRAPARDFVLWAWERPEDLRFLATRPHVRVAWFAGTVGIGDDTVFARPRVQPLRLAPSTPAVPVVRIAVERRRVAWDDALRADVRQAVGRIVDLSAADTLQIDFDVPESGRAFYRALLDDLRRTLPRHARLTMTALASWCLADGWIRDLPVAEAAPMLFRLGPAGPDVERRVARLDDWPVARCRGVVGLATDEPVRWTGHARRVYLFSTRAWTETILVKAMERLER